MTHAIKITLKYIFLQTFDDGISAFTILPTHNYTPKTMLFIKTGLSLISVDVHYSVIV